MEDDLSYTDIEFSHIDSFAQATGSKERAARYGLDINFPFNIIFVTFLISYVWTLALTAIPLSIDVGPNTYYEKHKNWYTGNDVMRLVEPIGGFVLNFIVMQQSGIFRKEQTKRNLACIFFFFFGAALYGQGAGFHSSANMFHNALETINYDDPILTDLSYYMRTIWQHIVGHYMYAAGYAVMNACQAFAYRELRSPQMGLTFGQKIRMVLASIVYALLIIGVAVDFPSGTIVALIYLVLYGVFVIGGYMVYVNMTEVDSTVLVFGHRPVLHHLFLSYCLALVGVIVWVCVVGGFKSRSEAGVMI